MKTRHSEDEECLLKGKGGQHRGSTLSLSWLVSVVLILLGIACSLYFLLTPLVPSHQATTDCYDECKVELVESITPRDLTQ